MYYPSTSNASLVDIVVVIWWVAFGWIATVSSAEGLDNDITYPAVVEPEHKFVMPGFVDQLALIQYPTPNGRIPYSTGLRIHTDQISTMSRSIVAVIESHSSKTDVTYLPLQHQLVPADPLSKQIRRIANAIGSLQNEVLLVDLNEVPQPNPLSKTISPPIGFRYQPLDSDIANSTLIGFAATPSDPDRFELKAWKVRLTDRQRPEGYEGTPGTGGILLDDRGVPWGMLPARAGITSTVFHAQVYPLPKILRDLKPSVKRIRTIRPQRSPNRIDVRVDIVDTAGMTIGHTLHIGRPRNVLKDFAANPKRLGKVADAMLAFRPNPIGIQRADSVMLVTEPIRREEGFVFQVEFHHADGSSTFDRPFYSSDLNGDAKHIPVSQLLKKHAASFNLSSKWYEPMKPKVSDQVPIEGEPLERAGLTGFTLKLTDALGLRNVVWSTDSIHAFGLYEKQSILKVDLSSGSIVGRVDMPVVLMDLDISQQGIVALGQQQVFLLDEDTFDTLRSTPVPGAIAVAAATQSDRVFATSGSRLYELFTASGDVEVVDHLAAPRPPMESQSIDDMEMVEDGSALLISDLHRIHRYPISPDPISPEGVRWQQCTEKIKRVHSRLIYPQGGRHVTVLPPINVTEKNTFAAAPDHPTAGLYVYDVGNLAMPAYCIRNLRWVALHPDGQGFLGLFNAIRRSSRLVFGNQQGVEVDSLPGKAFRNVYSYQWSPDGKYLFAALGRGSFFRFPKRLPNRVTDFPPQQAIFSDSTSAPVQVDRTDLDGWTKASMPWPVPSLRDAQTWSADGRSLYVITYARDSSDLKSSHLDSGSDEPPRFGFTVRKLRMPDLVQEHSTTFAEPIDFIGLSASGLVVRYHQRQTIALLDPNDLNWIKDVGIPNPVGITTSPKLDSVWVFRIDNRLRRPAVGSLHEFDLATGRPLRVYSSSDLRELVQSASPDFIDEKYLTRGASHGSPFDARLAPNGQSLFTNSLGICRFDLVDGKLVYGDCVGPVHGFSSSRQLFVSHDSALVAAEGLSQSNRSPVAPKRSGTTVIFDARDLSRVVMSGPEGSLPKGIAVDTVSKTSFCTENGYKLLVARANQSTQQTINGLGHGSYETSITASPIGEGVFLIYGNHAMWFQPDRENSN